MQDAVPGHDATASKGVTARPTLIRGVRELFFPPTPTPPPPLWARFTLITVGATIVACGLLALSGWFFRDKPSRHFGEWRLGTFMSVGFLLAAAYLCYQNWAHSRGQRLRAFWFCMAVLLAFLGIDDLLKIHEALDHHINRLMGWNRRWVWADRIDDMIVMAYSLPAMVLAWVNRFELLKLRWTVLALAAAFGCFALMGLYDMLRIADTLEDILKIVACALIFCAFAAVERPAVRDVSPTTR